MTARKQARGMARGYLGNALQTEMLFSASVAQWKRMLEQRLTPAADAEIRLVYELALAELKRSRYGAAFERYELVDSPDGLGKVLASDKV
jgi:thymidylate synthase ThyX